MPTIKLVTSFKDCHEYYIDADPEDETFFAIFGGKDGSFYQIAGGIGEHLAAEVMAEALAKASDAAAFAKLTHEGRYFNLKEEAD